MCSLPRDSLTTLTPNYHGNKKIHTLQSVMHGRSSFTLQRGSTLLALSVQSLSFDDNGITGLFSISHSEVVFVSFPVKPLAAQSLRLGGSLCHIFTDYSSLQRVFFLFTPCIVDSFFSVCKVFFTNYKKIFKKSLFICSSRSTFYTFYRFHMDMGRLDIPYPLSRLFLIFSALSIIHVFFPV